MPEQLLVSASDAASMLGISRSLFYELLSSQRIPIKPVKLAKRTLFVVEQLRRWTDENCKADWNENNG
jgi:predicted DNA-binding transcriptional regulator AlpA